MDDETAGYPHDMAGNLHVEHWMSVQRFGWKVTWQSIQAFPPRWGDRAAGSVKLVQCGLLLCRSGLPRLCSQTGALWCCKVRGAHRKISSCFDAFIGWVTRFRVTSRHYRISGSNSVANTLLQAGPGLSGKKWLEDKSLGTPLPLRKAWLVSKWSASSVGRPCFKLLTLLWAVQFSDHKALGWVELLQQLLADELGHLLYPGDIKRGNGKSHGTCVSLMGK